MRGLAKAFAVPVLDGIDLDVRAGEVHALVGENGAGKSTLARIVAGLLSPDRGDLFVDGAAVAPGSTRRRPNAQACAWCSRNSTSIPTWSVAENVWLGRPLPTRFGVIDRAAARST